MVRGNVLRTSIENLVNLQIHGIHKVGVYKARNLINAIIVNVRLSLRCVTFSLRNGYLPVLQVNYRRHQSSPAIQVELELE